jgi:hypothetical protein
VATFLQQSYKLLECSGYFLATIEQVSGVQWLLSRNNRTSYWSAVATFSQQSYKLLEAVVTFSRQAYKLMERCGYLPAITHKSQECCDYVLVKKKKRNSHSSRECAVYWKSTAHANCYIFSWWQIEIPFSQFLVMRVPILLSIIQTGKATSNAVSEKQQNATDKWVKICRQALWSIKFI